MALAVTTSWCVFTAMNWDGLHRSLAVFILHQSLAVFILIGLKPGQEASILTGARTIILPMPRLRGKSRRGTAWYRAESRRRRIHNFERALALATTRRKRRPWLPPMAIIEEISLEEAIQHHPSLARAEETKPPPEDTRWNLHMATTEDLFPPCIVEEEDPPDDNTGVTVPTGQPTREERDSSTRASDNSGGSDQPPGLAIGNFQLIFELRNLMDDQAFRLARMDSRLDMLFAAYSKSSLKRQCPTCAQVYSLPAGWRQKRNDHPNTSK
jgi:hypothetical protein